MNVQDERVRKLTDWYFVQNKKLHTTVGVRNFLVSNCGIPTTLQQAYAADIEARNVGNKDHSTKTVVAPAFTDGYARNPLGDADEDLESEVAMLRRECSEIENSAARFDKYAEKHPNDIDVQRLAQLVGALENKAIKLRHQVEALITTRFNR